MPEIRPVTAQDLPAVAALFQRLLRSNGVDPRALADYLKTLFLEGPNYDPELASKVHVRDDGTVSGFFGIFPLAMEHAGRTLRAAVCGTFMVDARKDDPFAGARLLRDVLSGPQDLSFTETSNDLSTALWQKVNGHILPDYSLEWLRILRPVSFVADSVAKRVPGARLLTPLLRPFDALAQRAKSDWYGYVPEVSRADAFTDGDVSEDEAAEIIPTFLRQFALRPQWDAERLRYMLAEARRKVIHGERVLRVVRARSNGAPIGLFLYYGDRGRLGRVVQVLSLPGREGLVIDRMMRHADSRNMPALRGRTQPALLGAMMGRKIAFVHAASTIVHSRDPKLIEAFTSGQAFVNGLAGEGWTRLIGDRFT
ncbi:hypothetical protein ACFWXH_25455 [Mesorhizobium sp. NPDC059054]|uniref:hypothetical protein n=1 Tax=Mesorhizobium sp. NPDC059054 TaxID=3346711 RepID=UPI003679C65D